MPTLLRIFGLLLYCCIQESFCRIYLAYHGIGNHLYYNGYVYASRYEKQQNLHLP